MSINEKITKYVYSNFVEYVNEKGEAHNINDEPSRIWNDGTKFWCRNNKRHRTKGPAAIHSEGDESWWYEDNDITDKVKQLIDEGKIDPDWRNWSEEDEFLFVLLVS